MPTADPRSREPRRLRLVWLVPVLVLVFAVIVFVARAIRESPAGTSFLDAFPGASTLPDFAPVGFPAWLAWQHALAAFFLLFIVRTGLILRSKARPTMFWRRRNDGRIRTAGAPVRITLTTWTHLVFNALWVLNGVLFYVLLFATGQWTRIVPTNWDVVPNAISAALQYASLDWPTEDGWTNYNALQLVSYFLIVFVAAPLAVVTGIRIAPGLALRLRSADRWFPLAVARRIHVWTMVFFLAFTVVHVTLVLATGALRNLNHFYAVRDDESWIGFTVLAGSVVVSIGALFALSPRVLAALASFTGRVDRR